MIFEIGMIIVILFSAIILHEYAHGWVAFKLGDSTAKMAGRLTLNPIKHVDRVGTIILPGILLLLKFLGYPVFIFGWAKPVPVNFMRLYNPKRDMIWVAMAGPVVNVILAVIFSFFIRVGILVQFQYYFSLVVFINLLLAIFNMIPVPPLDGSRLVMGLLPSPLAAQYARLERYGILIVVGLLYLGLFDAVIIPAVEVSARMLGVNL